MRFNARFFQKLEIVHGRFQVCFTNTFDRKSNRVFTRIEHAVFARAIVFEFKHNVAVIKLVHVFRFTCIDLFHNYKTS